MERRYRDPEWETLDREQLRKGQFELLQTQLTRLAATNPFFADRWREAGVDVAKVTDQDEFARMVPMISKQDLIADQEAAPPFGTRLGVDRSELNGLMMTSGTTGIGQEMYGLTAQDQIVAGEGFAHAWTIAGVQPGDVIVVTPPVNFLSAGLACVQSAHRMQVTPIYGFGVDKTRLVELIGKLGVSMVYAPPNLFLQLQEAAKEMGFDPRTDAPALRGLTTSLIMPPFSLVYDIQDFWGVPLYDIYGSTQASSGAAVSCEHGVWDGERRYPTHFLEQHWLFEVVDPETGIPVSPGEEGELVVTSLRRQASPVVRFRMRDRVVHAPWDSCPCGRPFDGMVPGETSRYDDMLKIKGMNVWPAAVDTAVFEHREVEEYRGRVVLHENGREDMLITVSFKDDAGLSADERANLVGVLVKDVKQATNVTPKVVEVDHLDAFDFKPQRWTDERKQGLQKITW